VRKFPWGRPLSRRSSPRMANGPGARLNVYERRLRWRAHVAAAAHPRTAAFVNRRFGAAALAADTAVVIDGFPRSANTFTVAAFQLAQAHPVRVAHHLHSAGALIAACRRDLPVMMLIREPPGPLISTLRFSPYLDLSAVARWYLRFHERLLPWRERMVVVPFDAAVAHADRAVIARNDRFGTTFAAPRLDEEHRNRIDRIIDAATVHRGGAWPVRSYLSGKTSLASIASLVNDARGGEVTAHLVARPVSGRPSARDLEAAWERLGALRHETMAVYREFAGAAALPAGAP
jgi:hypothetical protein